MRGDAICLRKLRDRVFFGDLYIFIRTYLFIQLFIYVTPYAEPRPTLGKGGSGHHQD